MLNRTLLFGEGLFETIRWKPSEEKLKLHYNRLLTSAQALGIPCPSFEEFFNELMEAVSNHDGLYVKYVLLSKGGDYLADSPEDYGKLIVVKDLKPQPSSVSLCLSPYRRHSSDPVCRHKTTSYLFNLLVKRDAINRGFWDGVIVNEKGHVCETSTSNLLLVKGSRLFTPARDSGLLWGTTIEFLRRRLTIEEEYISLDHLEKYDGVFVINSLLLCGVVESIEGKALRVDLQAYGEIRNILKDCLWLPPEAYPQDR
ncbi:MAG: aminotransferase class IV [Aquificaceae bacterium]|nr:aminotransferase class IV [Aquificaceae bacterium]